MGHKENFYTTRKASHGPDAKGLKMNTFASKEGRLIRNLALAGSMADGRKQTDGLKRHGERFSCVCQMSFELLSHLQSPFRFFGCDQLLDKVIDKVPIPGQPFKSSFQTPPQGNIKVSTKSSAMFAACNRFDSMD